MSTIKILDCTLRDGGYCNQWRFGEENIQKISYGLADAGIEIIELGFLTNRTVYDPNVSKYNTVEQAAAMIPTNRAGKLFVCMANYGEYTLDELPKHTASSIDGIRVAFHKKDLLPALELCRGIKEKGYLVFIQAMVSLNYSDEEFLDLIRKVNEFEPYAFYIVDSFGVMKHKDLIRLFYLVEHNLKDTIKIGFHSHNNMQLAYSNAQSLVDLHTSRDLIIDSSVYGMGRGAGNLNTELFVEYLNDNHEKKYTLKPLLTIIDEILNDFYQQNYWGYSLPNYLSAKHNSHPNYASYLDDKKTLTVEAMDDIFSMMDEEKRSSFDKSYIEDLYIKYMTSGETNSVHLVELQDRIAGKSVLVIAPGRSSLEEREKVIKCAVEQADVTISINFEYEECKTDYIFLSNLRRFRELAMESRKKCIVTSNIPSFDVYLKTPYRDLLNKYRAVEDNAGMMLVKYLIRLGAKKILFAGLDGYSVDAAENYANEKMNFYTRRDTLALMNIGMSAALSDFAKQIDLEFVTTPKYVRL